MQRVELLTGLEQQTGRRRPGGAAGGIYSVRDLVDAVLESAGRGEGGAKSAATPAWTTILGEPVTDPEVLGLARRQRLAEIFFLSRFHGSCT